jgi:ATP-dependent DNA helicase RecG
VEFQKLGLVIIDEQHRFGVRQRARLSQGATDGKLIDKIHPDVLILTATPIPRTLALTLYGDLDVSVIDEMPAGRPTLKTRMTNEATALAQIESEVNKGHQAYIVFPLVEESEKLSKKSGSGVKAATKEFERLQQRFPDKKVGLLHGQMNSDDKKKIMELFRQRQLHILVATPVIEVGIDIANATVIAIMNPERFGLAQLHQLRGRVGRGTDASECLLVCDEASLTNERLQIFCSTTNGFQLSEEDLKLRGPGEFLGEAQHGVPFFRVGDLLKDGLLIAQARQAAKDLVDGVYPLTFKEADSLNRELRRKFGNRIRLSNVG